MNYWQLLINEVTFYEKEGFRCLYSNLQETDIYIEKMDVDCPPPKKKRKKVTYPLPSPFDLIYLTEREAECIFCMQQNQTIKSTGILLNLSARTVEFYLKNVKIKMNLRTKSEILHHLEKYKFDDANHIHETLLDLMRVFKFPSHSRSTNKQTPIYYC